MKHKLSHIHRQRPAAGGFTLVELMVSVGLGILLLAVVALLFINGSRSFVAMGNYQDLDVKSMRALDTFSMEIRNATGLVSYTPGTSLTLTNATAGTLTKLTYNATARNLVMVKTLAGVQTVTTNLTGCDSWSFSLYNKAPNTSSTNITFNAAAGAADCKLISMNWRCSRTILGSKLNTESVQTAQVVLRNKVTN